MKVVESLISWVLVICAVASPTSRHALATWTRRTRGRPPRGEPERLFYWLIVGWVLWTFIVLGWLAIIFVSPVLAAIDLFEWYGRRKPRPPEPSS
jgi:hypothetical protein